MHTARLHRPACPFTLHQRALRLPLPCGMPPLSCAPPLRGPCAPRRAPSLSPNTIPSITCTPFHLPHHRTRAAPSTDRRRAATTCPSACRSIPSDTCTRPRVPSHVRSTRRKRSKAKWCVQFHCPLPRLVFFTQTFSCPFVMLSLSLPAPSSWHFISEPARVGKGAPPWGLVA